MHDFELVKLFEKFGADIRTVDMQAVFDSGNPVFIKYCLDRGADAVTDQPFAKSLQHPQRPLLGVYMKYRDKIPNLKHQVNLALRYLVQKGNKKWCFLLLWAGADPFLKPAIGEEPDGINESTAFEEAVRCQQHEIIEKIGFEHPRVNLQVLLESACLNTDWVMIQKLIELGADPKPTTKLGAMDCMIGNLAWEIERWPPPVYYCLVKDAHKAVLRFADLGGRFVDEDLDRFSRLRRVMYRMDQESIRTIIAGFKKHSVMPEQSLSRFANTANFKKILGPHFFKLMMDFLKKVDTTPSQPVDWSKPEEPPPSYPGPLYGYYTPKRRRGRWRW